MNDEQINIAINLLKEGKSFKYIGKTLNVDRKKVSKVLKSLGYKPNYSFPEHEVWRKYQFNENYFEKIDTEYKAYWLGFLYADGYVNSNKSSFELGLQKKDYNHIIKFINSIEGNMPIHNKLKKTDNKTYEGCVVFINSEKFKKDLIDKGCLPNKSLILKFPTIKQVPKTLLRHFIRGYIDGDGSYTLVKHKYVGKKNTTISYSITVEFAGTYDFCYGFLKFFHLENECTIHDLHKNGNPLSKKVLISGSKAYKIIETLFKDANIYLDRKYEKLSSYYAVISQNLQKTDNY